MARAGRFLADGHKPTQLPALLLCGCDLTAECLPATEEVRVQSPAAAPILHRLRVSTRPSLQNSEVALRKHLRAPRRQPAIFIWVVADKQCTCPASKVMWERYPPAPPISTAGNSTKAQREAS